MFHSHRVEVVLHENWKYGVLFVPLSLWMPRCCLAWQKLLDSGCDASVCASLPISCTPQVYEGFHSLMGFPLTVIGVLSVVLIFINCVFFLLILSPISADMVSRRVVLSCIWLWLCDRSGRLSAKSRSSSCTQSVHCIPFFLLVVVVFMIQSMTNRKRNGDSSNACLRRII